MRKSLNINPFEKKRKIIKVGFISSLENQVQVSAAKNQISNMSIAQPVKYIKKGKVKFIKPNSHDTVL